MTTVSICFLLSDYYPIFSFPFPSSKHNHHPHPAHTHTYCLLIWSFIKVRHCHVKIQYDTNQNYTFLKKKSQTLSISLSPLTPMMHIKLVLGFTTTLGPGYTFKHIPFFWDHSWDQYRTGFFCPEFFCLLIYSQALLYSCTHSCTSEILRE